MKAAQGLSFVSGVPEVLTVSEVCRALKINRRTLYRRKYRYTSEGGRRLYFADDIRMGLLLNTTTPE